MNKTRSFAINVALAFAWSYFAYVNLSSFLASKNPAILLFVLAQTEFAFLVLVRKDAFSLTKDPLDYVIACAGTFVIFFYRPAPVSTAYLPLYFVSSNLLIYLAALLEVFGFLSLGKSTGIIPANRGVKTGGAYQFVRHPVYLGSLLLSLGYFLLSPLPWNLGILILAIIFQTSRIDREEKILALDENYKKYRETVKWRLLPGLY